jgi:hypothetical protein
VIDSEYQPELNDNTPSFPWPPRDGESPIDALASTWKESVFSPAHFFRRMPREFDFGWVLGYYLIVGVVAAGINLFWRMLLGPSLIERFMPNGQAPANPITEFLMSPLMLVIALFIAAGVVHLFLLMFGGAKHGFSTTARVFCFSSGPGLFAVVPFVGPFVGGIWTLVMTVIGLREAHETSTGKAIASLLVPFVLLSMLMLFVFFAMIAAGLVVDPR